MYKWAENECNVAKINADAYTEACIDSALRAYKCLINDNHSGMSMALTKDILNRLIDRKNLTPITDKDFEFKYSMYDKDYLKKRNIKSELQCHRYTSLFRTEYLDGEVKYSDVNRVICFDVNDEKHIPFSNGLATDIVDDMFPITLPYMPTKKPYKVYVEEFLTDIKNGDFDTVKYCYVYTPEYKLIYLNKYYKELNNKWVEIDETEYEHRKGMKIK